MRALSEGFRSSQVGCDVRSIRIDGSEAFLRRYTGDDVEVAAAGTIAADRPDPKVVDAMREAESTFPRRVPSREPTIVAQADSIITNGLRRRRRAPTETQLYVSSPYRFATASAHHPQCQRRVRAA